MLPTKNFFYIGYDVVICKVCNFCFADTIPNQAFFDEYYRLMTKKTFLLKKRLRKNAVQDSDIEGAFVVRQQQHSLSNILRFLPKQARILDVGCYTGRLLAMLKKRGYTNILGLDPSLFAVKVAKEQYGIKIILGSLFDNPDIGKFDFIILTHVLEHIKELREFIFLLSSYLNPHGRLYIETPNAHKFFLAEDKSTVFSPDQIQPFLQFSIEHINYFSRFSILNLMQRNGFKKIFLAEESSTIAILSSVWEKESIYHDTLIHTSVVSYIKESYAKISPIRKIIGQLIKHKTPIIVWGAGLHTQFLLKNTDLIQANIHGFVDSDTAYRGAKLAGKKIYSPSYLKKVKASILISSRMYQEEIERQIIDMGLQNNIILLYHTRV